MKRLIKKNIQNNFLELDQLSEADVRHERCPNCKYKPLVRKDGFKICPRCETCYKILDGSAYIIPSV